MITEQIENFGLTQKDKPKALFSHVGIVGCGSTGQRIALMIARKGIEVIFLELNQKKIDEAYEDMSVALRNTILHWGMTESEKKLVLSRITGTTKYEDFAPCDLVVESILSSNREYSLDIRKAVFQQIEDHVSDHCIIATNSTTTVITEFASEMKHKKRCLSLHFSTTSRSANLVEIVQGVYVSDEVSRNIEKFAKLVGRTPINVEESPGLISVRMGIALISEGCDALMEGVGTKEDIDYVCKNSLGMNLGPFELADKVGIDRVTRWMDNMYSEFGDMRYKPSPVLKKLLRSNRLGRKTKEGFYKYDEQGQKIKQL